MSNQLVLYIACSLDGYIATPAGDVAWLAPFEQAGYDYGYQDFYQSIKSIIVGRKTYEQLLGFGAWPYPDVPVYVLSRQAALPPPPAQADVRHVSGDLHSLLAHCRDQRPGDIWLLGGASLVQQCRAAQLIDRYRIAIIPRLLGNGIPLFLPQADANVTALQQTGFITYPNGVVQLDYTCDTD